MRVVWVASRSVCLEGRSSSQREQSPGEWVFGGSSLGGAVFSGRDDFWVEMDQWE